MVRFSLARHFFKKKSMSVKVPEKAKNELTKNNGRARPGFVYGSSFKSTNNQADQLISVARKMRVSVRVNVCGMALWRILIYNPYRY